jgi:hypothetical protein
MVLLVPWIRTKHFGGLFDPWKERQDAFSRSHLHEDISNFSTDISGQTVALLLRRERDHYFWTVLLPYYDAWMDGQMGGWVGGLTEG